MKLTKNADSDKYSYSRYDIGFDPPRWLSDGSGFDKNVITFGADMSSSMHLYKVRRYPISW